MTLRSFVLTAHQWMGLGGGLFLAVLGLTGTVLVFEGAIDRALHPATSYVAERGARLSLDSLVAVARANRPGTAIVGATLPQRPDRSLELAASTGRSLFVNPYSGALLGERDRRGSLARTVHLVHTQLVVGGAAKVVVGLASFMGMLLALSGIILWWPRRIVRVSPATASWRRRNFDLHNVSGLWSSTILLAITTTGVWINQEGALNPWAQRTFDRHSAVPLPKESRGGPGVVSVSLDSMLRAAQAALPAAMPTNISIPTAPTAIVRVSLKYADDRTPAGRSRVFVDQGTGALLRLDDAHAAEPGTRVTNLVRSLHTGDLLGRPTRALWFLASLALVIQAISGFLVWYRPKRD